MPRSTSVVHISARYRSQKDTLAFCTCGSSFSDQQRSLFSTVSPRKTCKQCQKSDAFVEHRGVEAAGQPY